MLMKKILLVEDDHLLSSILAESLRNALYEVDCVYDGDSAVARAIGRHCDLMLLDILLPGMDGFEVLSAVKSLEATKRTPVIVISNLSDQKSIDRMKHEGAASYLVKAHTTPEAVIAEIAKVLQAQNEV